MPYPDAALHSSATAAEILSAPGRRGRGDRAVCGRADTASGFTLIEVLVTLVILSVGLVMVLRALDTSVVALDEARYALRAERTIRDKMSELESLAAQSGAFAVLSAGGRFTTEDGLIGETIVEPADGSGSEGGGAESGGQLIRVTVALRRETFGTQYSASTLLWADATAAPGEKKP